MPFINVKTTQPIESKIEKNIKEKLGKAIKLLSGKSEQWLMVSLEPECHLYFQGKNDQPIAYVEVKVYGRISSSESSSLTTEISRILNDELHIASDHVYVSYFTTNDWGWSGENF